jgi:hypothetical protein
MPAWAISITQDRWSAGIDRNQGSTSSIRATLWVASAPDARSSRRSVAAGGGVVTPPSSPILVDCTPRGDCRR